MTGEPAVYTRPGHYEMYHHQECVRSEHRKEAENVGRSTGGAKEGSPEY